MVFELESTQIQMQIQRVLQSKTFRTSEVHRNLLSYLAEKSLAGTAESLKEYTVGLDVFAKPASYDPRQESVVRMHAARLRQKLTEYYHTEGADDPIVVDLPKGGFKVTFEPRHTILEQPAVVTPPLAKDATTAPNAWRRREIVLAACLILTAGCAIFFALQHAQVARANSLMTANWNPEGTGEWTPELQQIWSPLLATNRPLMVCLSTPLFVRFPGFGFVRDSSANDWAELSKSKSLSSLKNALHGPELAPSYPFTGVGTASGAFMLGQFLAQRKQNILLTRSDMLSLPEVAMDNVVFLGPMAGNRKIGAIPIQQQIVLEEGGIRNLNPRPGEPALLPDDPPQSQEIAKSYALVSHIPGLYGRGEILYFSGNQISSVMAAVQAFTDPNLARSLVSKMRTPSGGLPRYYQVVLQVKSMDDMPVEISYLFHRELAISKQSVSNKR